MWDALQAFTGLTSLGPVSAHALVFPAYSTDILTRSLLGIPVPNRPGIALFLSGVNDGVYSLVLMIENEHHMCPTRPIVLFGYSQGALVVNEALVDLKNSGSLAFGRVVGVGLISDPNRIGGTPYDFGSAEPAYNGIARFLNIVPEGPPQEVWSFTTSYCDAGDIVCAFGPDVVPSRHGAYAKNGEASIVGIDTAIDSGAV